MDDPSLSRQSALLVDALNAIDKIASSFKRSTTKVISVKDMKKEREKVRALVEGATKHELPAIHDAVKFLDRYLRLHPNHTTSFKLINDAKVALSTYQSSCDSFYQRCCEIERKTEAQCRKGAPGGDSDEDVQLSEKAPFLTSSSSSSQRQQFESVLHDEIMEERNREVREIAESVRDINEIFSHIHELVGEQGEKLSHVEENLQDSERSTRNASEQLRLAREAQDRSRRNQVVLLLIVVVVVGIIVAVLTA